MSTGHHPSEALLLSYAGGTLDPGEHIALATHLGGCAQCRALVSDMEALGGAMMSDGEPAAMALDAFSQIAGHLDAAAPSSPAKPAANPNLAAAKGLPPFVRRLESGKWRKVAPGLSLMPITPPADSPTRVFLLRAKPGMRIMPHGHDGLELTCILEGSFTHSGRRFASGDFDCGDDEGDHHIVIGDEGECLCLVALRGQLQLRGFAGRLMQPFIAI